MDDPSGHSSSLLGLLSPEFQAMIAGVQGEAPEIRHLDWERLSRLAAVHGVTGLLHKAWLETSDLAPPSVMDEFGRQRRESGLHGALGLLQRDEVVQVLESAGVCHIVLKGAALARPWYGDLSLRPFLDIDIWMKSTDIDRATAALMEAGYRQMTHAVSAPHHGVPFHRSGMPCALELHHELTPLNVTQSLHFDAFYNRSMVLEEENRSIRTLGPEDTLLQLCLHHLHHLEYSHGWRLRNFCDIARHIRAFPIEWPVFVERAREVAMYPASRAVLGLAAMVAAAEVPAEHIDSELAIELLQQPVLGVIRHHRRAAFLATVAKGDFSAAIRLLFQVAMEAWPSSRCGSRPGEMALRPQSASRFLGRLLPAEEPLSHRLQSWLPATRDWDKNEQLLARLRAAPDVSVEAPQARIASVDGNAGHGRERTYGRHGTVSVATVLCAAIPSLLFPLLLRSVRVSGTSMSPTLREGQRLIAFRRTSTFPFALHPGDIVIIINPGDRGGFVIKRVLAVPGETVKMRGHAIWVDGRSCSARYRGQVHWGTVTIPHSHYFLLGDNTRTSVDSRSWGPIPESDIVGKVWLSYWPPESWIVIAPASPRRT